MQLVDASPGSRPLKTRASLWSFLPLCMVAMSLAAAVACLLAYPSDTEGNWWFGPRGGHQIDATLALWGLNALAVLTALVQLALRVRPVKRILLGLVLAVICGVAGTFLIGPLDHLLFPQPPAVYSA